MYRNRTTDIFGGRGSIEKYFQKILKEIISEIKNAKESYILNISDTQYLEYLYDKFEIKTPIILFDEVYADTYEKNIPAEYFPFSFSVREGESYPRNIIQYFIPLAGNIELLKYYPKPHTITIGGGSCNFEVETRELKLEIIDFYKDPEKIKKKYEENLSILKNKYEELKRSIKNFNESLRNQIKSEFHKQKQKLLDKNKLMSSLGVPLKKKENVSNTFSVPRPKLKTKIKIRKPSVDNKPFEPEPTIDQDAYNQILSLINDVGKNFERMPSVYKRKGEEDLRDHILATLDPNFEFGSASGETFNKSGKTDIQLRYDSSVIFIAECKFWTGKKGYLKTISQLLNYLTWRDTKASVVVFVKQKDFSSVLNKVKEETSAHPNFVKYISNTDENWFNYKFHINGDKNREVNLAVQLFHIPD